MIDVTYEELEAASGLSSLMVSHLFRVVMAQDGRRGDGKITPAEVASVAMEAILSGIVGDPRARDLVLGRVWSKLIRDDYWYRMRRDGITASPSDVVVIFDGRYAFDVSGQPPLDLRTGVAAPRATVYRPVVKITVDPFVAYCRLMDTIEARRRPPATADADA